jgi:hypothetical protein
MRSATLYSLICYPFSDPAPLLQSDREFARAVCRSLEDYLVVKSHAPEAAQKGHIKLTTFRAWEQ